MKQKNIFLQAEGNAWFARNEAKVAARKLPEADFLLPEIIDICNQMPVKKGVRVLEIGCGDGSRLSWLKNNLNMDCYGVEPSALAVKKACSKGLDVRQGTSDQLPFGDQNFDIVIFGFCLYLCDREDLFRIASEADRVLRSPGWLAILDFFSPTPRANDYHHLPSIKSYKMNYRTLFDWHPNYEVYTHKLRGDGEVGYTDNKDEWLSISILRKFQWS